MTPKNKALRILKSELKHVVSKDEFDHQQLVIISELYYNRFLISERENKVMLDKLIEVTQGKDLVIETNSKAFGMSF